MFQWESQLEQEDERKYFEGFPEILAKVLSLDQENCMFEFPCQSFVGKGNKSRRN